MNNFLKTILGINIPSVDEVVEQAQEQQAQAIAAMQQQQAAQVDGPQAIGLVQFVLLSDGTLNLKMNWGDESANAGHVFGEFLYRIHSGRFKATCVELLLKMQQNDIRNKPFVEATCEQWNKLIIEDDEDEDEPMVNPLYVFGMSRGQGQETDD